MSEIAYVYYDIITARIVGFRYERDDALDQLYSVIKIPKKELDTIVSGLQSPPENGYVFFDEQGTIRGVSLILDNEFSSFGHVVVSTEIARDFLSGKKITSDYAVINGNVVLRG